MNLFKLGCNFSNELPKIVDRLNSEYPENRIEEFYGSRRKSHQLSARPQYRLPEIDDRSFTQYIESLHKLNIAFNYTLNSSYIGGKDAVLAHEKEIKNYITFLVNSGVKTITVTLPYMAELVRSVSLNVGLEVSTIAHVDSVTQAKIWHEKYGVTKICASLNKNRDISFLTRMAEYCATHNIVVTLLANEFCGNGVFSKGINSTTGCIYRDHCYQMHSIGYERECQIGNNYPMGECTQSREHIVSWLKLNYIRPEDLRLYNSIGINHFKITGRTGGTAYIERIARAYMAEDFNGNLLELWKHLETIGTQNEERYIPSYYIENKKLNGFLNYWFKNRSHICANEICGETCKYCDTFYQKHIMT